MKRFDPVIRFLSRSFRVVLLAGVLGSATSCKKNPGGASSKQNGFPGYTLVQQLGSKATNLIDAEGRVVHRWVSSNGLGGGTYLLENGNLLRSSVPAISPQRSATPGLTGMAELLDWDGNQLWSYTLCDENYCLHHDMVPMPNGNILLLAVEQLSTAEQIAMGRDPARAKDPLKLDYLIEMKPEGKVGGKVVWEWHLKDHLIQDFDKTKKNYGVVADNPGKVDINFIENLRKMTASGLRVLQSLGYVSSTAKITPQRSSPDWTHANSVTYHPELDQVMMSVRCLSELWIIDHSTTTAESASDAGGKMKKGGSIVYRWGNPQAYQSGAPADQMLHGQHDAQWIRPGIPGEGNILIFNNGEGRKEGSYSSIEEIKSPLKADGSYEFFAGEAFGPAKVEWQYISKKKEDFSSTFLSGVQRLPNGNTLICSGAQSHIFEVNPAGETVWDHQMEVTAGRGPGKGGKSGPKAGPKSGPMAGGPGVRRPGGPGMRRPGMGAGKAPGLQPNAAPGATPAATAEGTANTSAPVVAPAVTTADAPPQTAAPAEGGSEFTAAELAVLSGTPLQPPSGFAPSPGAGAGRGPSAGGPGAGGPGGPPGGGALFRATRYGFDYPAFKGRKLEPIAPAPVRAPK